MSYKISVIFIVIQLSLFSWYKSTLWERKDNSSASKNMPFSLNTKPCSSPQENQWLLSSLISFTQLCTIMIMIMIIWIAHGVSSDQEVLYVSFRCRWLVSCTWVYARYSVVPSCTGDPPPSSSVKKLYTYVTQASLLWILLLQTILQLGLG